MASHLVSMATSAGAVVAIVTALGGAVKLTGGDLPPYAPKVTTNTQIAQLSTALSRTQNDLTKADSALEGLERDRWRQIERDAEADLLVNPKSASAQRDRDQAQCEIARIDHPDWHLNC